ncbi:DUF4192 domain-containing protein [Microtetraspora sp. NBRC 16547]|uniref:DUF4192 domain-containing protein n=1 Tax=Microtetraspora sp. NBRC 16547 TaxID=3030993 RepID=UPI00249FDFDC|nr:DUF4192 domain-containing protein [Microtetraspora sp. NBRC 16547]GLX00744.1 hypothetical protein Misp02_48300 [Microtetraspora sp. NBRC 16547]
MTSISTLVLSTPADILAAVPYLLGFHPQDSLVVAAFAGSALRVTTRWDLPLGPRALDPLAALLRREPMTMAVLAGYGPAALVTPAIDEATRLLREAGVQVAEALRADAGRYWSYVCAQADCCPPEGTAYDPVSGRVAAEAVVHGLVALPDRRSLARSVESYGGLGRVAMGQATRRVVAETRTLLTLAERPDETAAAFVAAGLARVRSAIGRYDSGGRLDDEEAARLGLDLIVIRVRDEAWALIDDGPAHLALWRDLTRCLEPRFVAPAASLLAAAAWRGGDCALAGLALERALAADPAYSMANLLCQALRHLLPPDALRERMPAPEELDAQMGRPRMSWLVPLLAMLGEEPSLLAG